MRITDVVFTNHAIDRIDQRGMSPEDVWSSVKKPDKSYAGKEKHTTEFIKHINGHRITTIAKRNGSREWVVLSSWIDPPLAGTADYYKKIKYSRKLEKLAALDKKMEKASFMGKLWLTFRKQLGI